MFDAQDITPEAIDALADEFAALFAAADAIDSYRGPVAHVRTNGHGTRLSMRAGVEMLFMWSGRKAYTFPLADALQSLAALSQPLASVRLVEEDGDRSILLEVAGDALTVWMNDRHLTTSANAFMRAIARAEVLEVAR